MTKGSGKKKRSGALDSKFHLLVQTYREQVGSKLRHGEAENADEGSGSDESKSGSGSDDEDDDEDDDDGGLEEDSGDDDEEVAKALQEEDGDRREDIRAMVLEMTPEQMQRYECFRQATIPASSVRKVFNAVLGITPGRTMCIIVAGITKVYVGELVEGAKAVMAERGDGGPIQPHHLREAYRRIQTSKSGSVVDPIRSRHARGPLLRR